MDITALMADPIARLMGVGILVWGTIEMTMSHFEATKPWRPTTAVVLSLALCIALALNGMAGTFESPVQAVISGVLYGLATALAAKSGNDRLFNTLRRRGNTKPNQ